MIQLVNEFISAVLQIIAFTLIPFIVFLFRKDKSVTLRRYIGLYQPTRPSVVYSIFVSLIFLIAGIALVFIDDGMKEVVMSPTSVTGKLRAMGLNTISILTLLIIAGLKTSLSEEILFRGFIAKRLIRGLGFKTGNFLQALIFGLVHLVLIWVIVKPAISGVIILFIFSSLAGWVIGYIKEKYAGGSIIPGWIAHGLGNTLSYFIIAFVI